MFVVRLVWRSLWFVAKFVTKVFKVHSNDEPQVTNLENSNDCFVTEPAKYRSLQCGSKGTKSSPTSFKNHKNVAK
jgi:hypothetical protein